ncbi:hypothetical protein FXO38_11997 [Capsicum annuum]|nr:hypothetical protein FXO38_11997 [Capsicum annuum]
MEEVQTEQMKKEASSRKDQWLQRRNKYNKDKYGHIVGEVQENGKEMEISNGFEALNQENKKLQETSIQQSKQSTKEWVNETFDKVEQKVAEEQPISNNKKQKTQVDNITT